MISLKNTLEAIKTKLSAHDASTWYISDFAKSSNLSGTKGNGYNLSIAWTNIPSNATNIKFVPTLMKWVTPIQNNSITKSGTSVTAIIRCACIETTGDGYIGGVLMYQLS